MSIPPLPEDILSWSDDAAGRALGECWSQYQAQKNGVRMTPFAAPLVDIWLLVALVGPVAAAASLAHIEQAIAAAARQAIDTATSQMRTDEVRKLPLVKALRLAAKGKFERAGKMLKQIIDDRARQIRTERSAELGARVRTQRRKYSKRGNDSKKREAERKAQRWLEIGQALRAKNPEKSDSWLAAQIAAKTGDKKSTIRAAIPRLDLGRRKKLIERLRS